MKVFVLLAFYFAMLWRQYCLADLQTPAESSDFSTIPQYHLPMLNDHDRNQAYKFAIQKALVANHSVVLDVGAGTGLLSLFAASAQAKQVVAVEHNPLLYEIGKSIVSHNHFDDKIAFYLMDSTEVNPELAYEACLELQQRQRNNNKHHAKTECSKTQTFDLVVTELFDSWILGEFIFTTLGDLYDRKVINTQTKVIPSKGNLFIQLVQSVFSFSSFAPQTVEGFNYSAYGQYNLYTFNEITLNAAQDITKHISNVVNVFNFSFEPGRMIDSDGDSDEDIGGAHDYVNHYFNHKYQQVLFHINETAVVHGLLFWFNLWMDREQTIKLSNEPYVTNSHWKQMFLPLKRDFVAYQDTYLSVQIAQLPRRYVVLSNHGQHRMVKFLSKCHLDQNEGIEIFARYKLRSSDERKGKSLEDDLADINCYDDVNNAIGRKTQCPTARLKKKLLEKKRKMKYTDDNDDIEVVEEELLFPMDGNYNEFNYWKAYTGQEFVAVIKLPTKDRQGRYKTIQKHFTVPEDSYKYSVNCTTKESCNSNSIRLIVFNIYCTSTDEWSGRQFTQDL